MKTQIKNRWFCSKHGLEGIKNKSWCFGCYKLDENTEMPVPYIGYNLTPEIDKKVTPYTYHYNKMGRRYRLYAGKLANPNQNSSLF